MPTLTQGAAVPSLYSHIAHSDDKEETDIPQTFKGVRPKQTKNRGRGKGKQPQQKPNPPPVQIQEEQYTYKIPIITITMRIKEVNLEAIDPIEAKLLGNFFRGQYSCSRGQHNQNPYQGQYLSNNYQGNNYQGNHCQYNNSHRGYHQGNNYGQFRG